MTVDITLVEVGQSYLEYLESQGRFTLPRWYIFLCHLHRFPRRGVGYSKRGSANLRPIFP
jgi:hypothetical protein